MTPLVSSLALTWGKAASQHIHLTASSGADLLTKRKKKRLQTRMKHPDSAAALSAAGGFTLKLTLKSRRASIWFWIMGIVFSSFSVFMVLITPSTLCGQSGAGEGTEDRGGRRRDGWMSRAVQLLKRHNSSLTAGWRGRECKATMDNMGLLLITLNSSPDQPNF